MSDIPGHTRRDCAPFFRTVHVHQPPGRFLSSQPIGAFALEVRFAHSDALQLFSKRFAHTYKPLSSHTRAFNLVWPRLVNRDRWPRWDVKVFVIGDIDHELMGWLRAAYELCN